MRFGYYCKTCPKWPLSKRQKIGFQDQLPLNAGQKYCRMLQGEHSAILSTFIKLPFVINTFVLSIFEWPFYTGFTVISYVHKVILYTCMHIHPEQSELPRPIPLNSVESDPGCTSRIYFDNAGCHVTLTLYNVMLMSQKPCLHNNKCDYSKTN